MSAANRRELVAKVRAIEAVGKLVALKMTFGKEWESILILGLIVDQVVGWWLVMKRDQDGMARC